MQTDLEKMVPAAFTQAFGDTRSKAGWPSLHVLDTGLMNYFAGIQREILSTDDLHKVYQGSMIGHLVGQELLAFQHQSLTLYIFGSAKRKHRLLKWTIYSPSKQAYTY